LKQFLKKQRIIIPKEEEEKGIPDEQVKKENHFIQGEIIEQKLEDANA
jgi:hypothetical protein